MGLVRNRRYPARCAQHLAPACLAPPAHRQRASATLSTLAASGALASLLKLRGDEAALNAALKAHGLVTVGARLSVRLALRELGIAPPLEPLEPLVAAEARQAEQVPLWIVCTHAREDMTYAMPLLAVYPRLRVCIYDCGIEPLPSALLDHPRVVVRDKSGALAPVPFFYGVFDFCTRHYDALPERVLFMHGHDTSWHQKLPVRRIIELSARIIAAADASMAPDIEYMNVNDRVIRDCAHPPLE